ncbi:hypothetical protein [Nocardioides sp. Kera G14]|uniref:hypothetical protein n=1 Tax=Nocardioides sp. Kera G14 TaxID=2884264 RepID=UPI001D1287FC|nr:hypothetical protein [Nocardioides sp. Kera G14]UDY22727.1 hypothetical protein LH076_11680 [Nocardioides sp. Kera G14]
MTRRFHLAAVACGWVLVLVLSVLVVGGLASSGRSDGAAGGAGSPRVQARDVVPAAHFVPKPPPATLPGGRTRVFQGDPLLVAYYGTAGSGALGVLGERRPDASDARLRAQAARFRSLGRPIQTVYELIVTVADAHPGKDGDFSHDLTRAQVQPWIDAAHRHNALVVLDIQPGRRDFLTVAQRWAWALADPWVGLALDPEWRMPPRAVPGRVIGHVDAAEINRVSAWLSDLTARRRLPEKLLLLHQFRRSMIRRPRLVASRPGLAMVQHVDGYGTRGQKLDTYHYVARPKQFTMGFKLFYDEDIHRMGPAAVGRIRPAVRFVSFQ